MEGVNGQQHECQQDKRRPNKKERYVHDEVAIEVGIADPSVNPLSHQLYWFVLYNAHTPRVAHDSGNNGAAYDR